MSRETKSLFKLRDVPFFSILSVEDLNRISMHLVEKTYTRGQFLHFSGDECQNITIVRSGRIKVFRSAPSGREQIIEILEPGDTCACNPGSPTWQCSSSAQALADCRVWVLSRTHYVRLVQNNLNISRALNQIFAKKMCQFCSFMENVALNNSKKKLIKFLIDMHEQMRGQGQETDTFVLPFTREEVAHRIGTTRETVTRHLSEFKRQKMIDVRSKHICINKVEELRGLLGENTGPTHVNVWSH
ncbi:MAG: Crp/Fnr family transcriptional regulator [Candidatus Omnitrophica bacterium]|nr:Crp/Fnr family transcriptional regulator [Candidatus Omnitrophota bacterium]